MIVPEIILKKILDGLLSFVRADFRLREDEQKTFLYQIFNGNVIEGYDYFVQAKELIMRGKEHQRYLDSRIFFDRTRASIPTIHITLPSESPAGDGIGFDSGYVQPSFNDVDSEFNENFTRTFSTKYNIIATSDNTFEVLIIHYLLKAMIIAGYTSFELNGLRNIRMSSQDLSLNDGSMPTNIFMRGITLDLFYEFSVPSLIKSDIILSIEMQADVDNITVDRFTTENDIKYVYSNENTIIT